MTRTTPQPPVDLGAEIPGLAGFARPATRLHPRPGAPTEHESHIGGPMLWPVNEPWPRCARPKGGWSGHDALAKPVAEIAVAQLFARDVPGLPFPAGTDLLQVFWCPNEHDDYDCGPLVDVVWRDSSKVTEVFGRPPVPEVSEDDELRPRPCVLDPEVIVEYPFAQELPTELRQAVERVESENGVSYPYELAMAPGCKTGGWANWAVTDLIPMNCADCAGPMDLLLVIDVCEWDSGNQDRWQPVEDRREGNEEFAPTGVEVKDAVRVFLCRTSASHPLKQDIQ